MVITDLKKICSRCSGTGSQPGFSTLGINQINYDSRCPVCHGRGFELTELGEDVVKMMRPFIEEMIEAERLSQEKKAAAAQVRREAAEAEEKPLVPRKEEPIKREVHPEPPKTRMPKTTLT